MPRQPKKTRSSYEDWGVARQVIEQHWDDWASWGFVGAPEDEATRIESACELAHFGLFPRDGWAEVARELRIIQFQLPEPIRATGLSRSQMALELSKIAEDLDRIERQLDEIVAQEDFTMAALEIATFTHRRDKFEYVNLPNSLLGVAPAIRRLAAGLEHLGRQQTRKFRQASERDRRLVLACKCMPLFVEQFGQEPKLRGGSSRLPDAEESPWAQFFQAAAIFVLGEVATPDRQGILLEARLPTE